MKNIRLYYLDGKGMLYETYVSRTLGACYPISGWPKLLFDPFITGNALTDLDADTVETDWL